MLIIAIGLEVNLLRELHALNTVIPNVQKRDKILLAVWMLSTPFVFFCDIIISNSYKTFGISPLLAQGWQISEKRDHFPRLFLHFPALCQ